MISLLISLAWLQAYFPIAYRKQHPRGAEDLTWQALWWPQQRKFRGASASSSLSGFVASVMCAAHGAALRFVTHYAGPWVRPAEGQAHSCRPPGAAVSMNICKTGNRQESLVTTEAESPA